MEIAPISRRTAEESSNLRRSLVGHRTPVRDKKRRPRPIPPVGKNHVERAFGVTHGVRDLRD